MNQKELERMHIDGVARSLYWNTLSAPEQQCWFDMAYNHSLEIRPWILEEWPAHNWIVEQDAVMLAWEDLEDKEQRAYISAAQKKIHADSKAKTS